MVSYKADIMANIVDSTQELTIYLIREGFAVITNFTIDKAEARIGDPLTFSFSIRNDGSVDDLFGRIIDINTGEELHFETFQAVAIGQTVNGEAVILMPNKDLNVRLEAGHVEQ